MLSLTYTTFESDMRFILVFADRRATARTTTFVEPCSFQLKKKRQIVCERGQCGSYCTCVVPAPSESQHVPMCTEGNCPGRHPILVRCQWPFCARPKTHAWLWNHQEQLVSPDVSHPGQEIQAESLKGRKWTDYACQCEYIFFFELMLCALEAQTVI